MSLTEVLSRRHKPAVGSSLTNVNYVDASINRIFDRWPDVNPGEREEDQEKILKDLLNCLRNGEWLNVKMSFVILGFDIAFLPKYKNRSDVEEIINFALEELEATSKPSIVNALMRIYSSTFSLKSKNTNELGERLKAKSDLFNQKWKNILRYFPNYLVSDIAPESIADFMASTSNAWASLKRAGINDPFAAGIMDYVHEAYVKQLAPRLHEMTAIEELFEWLIPELGKHKTRGNVIVVEALLNPWLHKTPPEELRQYITENLISLYDDPRIRPERWTAIEDRYKEVLFNWLTKEDLRFFTSVVDEAQKDPMWAKRRNFWLKLYDEGLIDQAWVAFCPSAERFARQNLTSGRIGLSANRFARQIGRPDTSVLILKIGSKIFVDGCHNYSTHVWNVSDPVAPRLFKSEYDCDLDLRMKSPVGRGKSHSSIPSWSSWVREKIYAPIPNSNKKPVNWDTPRRNFAFTSPAQATGANFVDTQQSSLKNKDILGNSNGKQESNYQKRNELQQSINNGKTLKTFDINFDQLVNEVINLNDLLESNELNTFNLKSSINKVLQRKVLYASDKSDFEKLFLSNVVSPSDYPNLHKTLQPIFKQTSGHDDLKLWRPVINGLLDLARENNILVSPNAQNALNKIRNGALELERGDVNSFEHFLQDLRANYISIDQLFL